MVRAYNVCEIPAWKTVKSKADTRTVLQLLQGIRPSVLDHFGKTGMAPSLFGALCRRLARFKRRAWSGADGTSWGMTQERERKEPRGNAGGCRDFFFGRFDPCGGRAQLRALCRACGYAGVCTVRTAGWPRGRLAERPALDGADVPKTQAGGEHV